MSRYFEITCMRSPSCMCTKFGMLSFALSLDVDDDAVCCRCDDARKKIPNVICPLFRLYSANARSVFPLRPPLTGSTSTMEHRAQGPTTSNRMVLVSVSFSSPAPLDKKCRLVQPSSKCAATTPGLAMVRCCVVVHRTTKLGRN